MSSQQMRLEVSALLVLLLAFIVPSSLSEAVITPSTSIPSAPRNLVATIVANRISLAWTPPTSNGDAAITGYKIYRGTFAGGESLIPLDTLGNVTSIIDNLVSDGTTYFYVVRATNSAGDSLPSNEASAMVPIIGGLPIMPLAGSSFIIILMLALLVLRRRRVVPESADV